MDGYSIEDFDLSQIQSVLDEIFGSDTISFSELVVYLMKGDFADFSQQMKIWLQSTLLLDMQNYYDLLGQLFIIAIASVLLSYLVSVFGCERTGESAFFVTYLMIIALLLGSFALSRQIALGSVTSLISFMKALLPVFMVAAGLALSATAATIYYETVFVIIALCSWVLGSILIPLIETGMILSLVNHISKEAFLSKLRDLIFMLNDWILRTMLTGILGFQILQNLIVPVMVGTKTKLVQNIIYHLPGIGDGAESIGNAVTQAGIVIRNGIGGAALLVIVLVCLLPILKLWIMTFLFYLAAALLQPVADSRMIACIQSFAEGNRMLVRTVFLTALFFFLTIALICSAGNGSG